MKTPKEMLKEAKKDYAAGMNWMDFSNKYFGPNNPYAPKTQEERAAFVDSAIYREVQEMKEKLADSQPDTTAPTEKEYSGAISLRVPKSLHRSLVEEADAEGVSLNQLILAKISVTLYDMTKARK
jgi:predicted HicB family RNase H-like nuclease